MDLNWTTQGLGEGLGLARASPPRTAQTGSDFVHLRDTAPSAGFPRGNEGAGVDKILHARTGRPAFSSIEKRRETGAARGPREKIWNWSPTTPENCTASSVGLDLNWTTQGLGEGLGLARASPPRTAQTGSDFVHLRDTAPSAGFPHGNGGAGVDKILHARTVRPLCGGKQGQRGNVVDNTDYAFRRPRPGATGGRHAPAALLTPSSLAGT